MATKIHFRNYNPKQTVLFPQRIDKDIAENDPVRVVDTVIDNLKLENFRKLYKERGRSPYHPRMMLKAVIYGYMNNIYSCRKIESALKRDIHFIWLAGYEQPDFNTINRFRNRVKEEINQVFTQLVVILAEKGFVTLEVEYVDGTKIESKANKYTFVWRKSTEKNRAKLMAKINALLEQVDEAIAQENALQDGGREFTPADLTAIADELNRSLQRQPQPVTKEEKQRRKEKEKQVRQLKEHAGKLGEYDEKLRVLGGRNSYSKTDPCATFMRMKEDTAGNGQPKPGYNLQLATENQFIVDFGLFQFPGDPFTLIPMMGSFLERYHRLPEKVVSDSGYGSEENYRYMDEAGIEAYVKYSRFDREHRPRHAPDPFSPQSLYYNAVGDYYVCPMGQRMERIGTVQSKTESGYAAEIARYKARRCEGCPLRGRCFKAKGDRIIEVNHRLNEYRRKAAHRLTSEEGVRLRRRRSIEPEAVFGQMKYDMGYKRFRHFGTDKVKMDFAFFAIAFNLKKMCARMAKSTTGGGSGPKQGQFAGLLVILYAKNQRFGENPRNMAA